LTEQLAVDASFVLQACLEADGFALIAERTAIAPHLAVSETLSALRQGLFRGVIGPELAAAALERLRTAPVVLQRPPELLDEAWRLAAALGWAKTYDAEYVALARITGSRLLTIDARLKLGAARVVNVIGPTEL
jgi:predicted nucleic acid-binding protein